MGNWNRKNNRRYIYGNVIYRIIIEKKQKAESLEIGSVFIIGFTKQIFKNELLRYPELGFISRDELKRLKFLTKLVSRGTQADINNLRDFIIRIKKKIF